MFEEELNETEENTKDMQKELEIKFELIKIHVGKTNLRLKMLKLKPNKELPSEEMIVHYLKD